MTGNDSHSKGTGVSAQRQAQVVEDVTLAESSFRPHLRALPPPRAVFVSARTDELWLERNAASAAIATSGLTPLVFDSALNKLSDEVVPEADPGNPERPQKRLSGKRNLRSQVDSLIDASDFFVGVYFHTAGLQEYSTGWLTWVEYELVRFLMRHLLLEDHGLLETAPLPRFHEWKPLAEEERKQLNDFVRSTTRVAEMRRRLQEMAAGSREPEVERLRTVVESRCLLFHKRSREVSPQLSHDLQVFLHPLRGHLREIRTTVREAHSNLGDFHYFPSHAHLFETIHSRLRGVAQPVGASTGRGVRIRVERRPDADHRVGLLYPLLREVFQRGLSIQQLFVGCSESTAPAPGITCFATSPREGWNAETDRLHLAERVESVVPGLPGLETHVEVAEPPPTFAMAEQAPGKHAYEVVVLDTPGAVWSVCTLIASYGFDMTYVHFDTRVGSGATPVVTSASPGVALAIAFEDGPRNEHRTLGIQGIATFEYQLKSLHGVVSIAKTNSPP